MADQAERLRLLAAESRRPAGPAGAPRAAAEPLEGFPRARVVTVASGKGGVGKTNLSVNLALQLCALGRSVILFDADLGLANADLLLGVRPRWNLTHFFDGGRDLADILCEGPLGLKLIASGSGISELADMGEADRARVLEQFARLEEMADFLIVDTGAGISRNVLAFALASEEVLVVTTPEPTARLDAYGLIKVLAQHSYAGRLRVVVNMAQSRAEGEDVARLLETLAGRFLNIHVETLGIVPYDREVPRQVRAQKPFVLERPLSPASRAVAAMAGELGDVRMARPPGGLKAMLEQLGKLLRPRT